MTHKTLLYTTLFLSLGVNIFIGGYLIGEKSHVWPHKKSSEEMVLRGMLRELPQESRKALGPMIQNSKKISRENREKIIQARRLLLEQMSKPELDKQKLKETMDTIEQLSVENLSIAQNILYETIIHASFEERLKLIEAFKRHRHAPKQYKRYDR